MSLHVLDTDTLTLVEEGHPAVSRRFLQLRAEMYLEDANLWPTFHARAIDCLFQVLLPGLTERYRLRLQHRSYASEWAQPVHAEPSRQQEDYIELCERKSDRLVTLVDMVSPANKLTESGRRAYLETRSAARAQGASVVEIDLVLQGRRL